MLGTSGGPPVDRDSLDVALAERLVRTQFPQWVDLPVRPVDLPGWDNRTFRLGDEMSIRLPTGPWYALQVEKEQRWLPELAPQLPLPIPAPVAQGRPGEGYPYAWSVYRWIDGRPARRDRIGSLTTFATDLAGFLAALQRADATDGPGPGRHNFFRGGPLDTYESEARDAITELGDVIPGRAAHRILDEALQAEWSGVPVWFHGDVATGNLLVTDGVLSGVIDFGTSGVGDPACDVVIAWTLLDDESRAAFRHTLGVDDAMWARGRGWALWKALITYAQHRRDADPVGAADAKRVLDEIFTEHERS
ncbi:aminoglycoside phosphotransferase [Aeromicrobium sp. Root236]|uniref:aminoglycoside phosphotransferase family protein n=1 Tax=Aeromicrobium sp. Root236 TaxID=1736498 RepID=UPI0006F65FCD|nr:aminoglycoside phosphotransferase family protein [Aeromicrobium sp. Root236]KRC63363.1 aminoglycoside phosphotransferase [Aeromicrobium sp. Root236]